MIEFGPLQQLLLELHLKSSRGEANGLKVTGGRVTGSKISRSELEGCIVTASAPQLEIHSSQLIGCHFENLESIICDSAQLVRSQVRETTVKGSRLLDTFFEDCDFRNFECRQSEWHDCEFVRCDLSYTAWKNVFLNVRVRDLRLDHARFESCTFVRFDFTGLELYETVFSDCIFVDCVLSASLRAAVEANNLIAVLPKKLPIASATTKIEVAAPAAPKAVANRFESIEFGGDGKCL